MAHRQLAPLSSILTFLSILGIFPFYNRKRKIFQPKIIYVSLIIIISLSIDIFSLYNVVVYLKHNESPVSFLLTPILVRLLNLHLSIWFNYSAGKWQQFYNTCDTLDSDLKQFHNITVKVYSNVTLKLCGLFFIYLTCVSCDFYMYLVILESKEIYVFYISEIVGVFILHICDFSKCLVFFMVRRYTEALNKAFEEINYSTCRLAVGKLENLTKMHLNIVDLFGLLNYLWGWNIFLETVNAVGYLLRFVNCAIYNKVWHPLEYIIMVVWIVYFVVSYCLVEKLERN